MQMRDIIDRLNEAAHYGASTFWYHPKTRALIPTSDHGGAVRDNPDAFGVPHEVIDDIEAAMPQGYEDDEAEAMELDEPLDRASLPPLPAEIWTSGQGTWSRDDCFEIVAMNRGWVRCGLGGAGYPTYMSGSTPRSVLQTAKAFFERLGEKLEIEIVSQRLNKFVSLSGDVLAAFLQSTPAQAEAIIRE